MNKITTLLNELESKIPHSHQVNPAVSAVPVGWHIEHLLMSTSRIIKAISLSDPAQYKWRFNKKRILIMAIQKIPRGKGKAPKTSLPDGEISIESLNANLLKTRQKVAELSGLHPKNYFEHPYFGHLHLKAGQKFIRIHMRHHLNIINDILKANP